MNNYNSKSWRLVDEAASRCRAYASGFGTFADAALACGAAERWLDEGPDADGLEDLHKALSEARSSLPGWAVS